MKVYIVQTYNNGTLDYDRMGHKPLEEGDAFSTRDLAEKEIRRRKKDSYTDLEFEVVGLTVDTDARLTAELHRRLQKFPQALYELSTKKNGLQQLEDFLKLMKLVEARKGGGDA